MQYAVILIGFILVILIIMLIRHQKKIEVQPAKESYFFSNGFQDATDTIKLAWKWNKQKSNQSGWYKKITIYFVGGLVTAITMVLHMSFLVTMFLLVYLVFTVIWAADAIYTSVNRIHNICPNPECQKRFLLAVYECPSCGKKHTKLKPGKYGILKRKCNCENKIPTSFLNGRGKLTGYCPYCDTKLSGETANRQYAFPVIGGPSVGKTCFIHMTVKKMLEKSAAQECGWKMKFLDEKDERAYFDAIRRMDKGLTVHKTELEFLNAYQLQIDFPNDTIGRRIHFYDIAGEKFAKDRDIQKNPAYEHAQGLIFLIDPLSLSSVAMELVGKVDMNSYNVSEKNFDDIMDIMLANLDKMCGNTNVEKALNKNLAVVINKCDIPMVDKAIGEDALREYMEGHPECNYRWEAKNEICRQFLRQNEAGNFVRKVESKFKNVRYFSCSALGHNPDGTPFTGIQVEEPLLWLLQLEDSKFSITE